MRKDTDAHLITSIRAGDGAAVGELLREYGGKLLDVATPLVGSDDVAQDVVQDVFIRLWDTREQLQIHGSVAAYLYRAVRNRALDVRKHERAQLSFESRIRAEYDYEEPRVPNAGEVAVTGGDFDKAVEQALATLSPKLREVFLLRVDHDLSYPEIAQTLGIAVTSVRIQMYRATTALSKKLELWAKPEV